MDRTYTRIARSRVEVLRSQQAKLVRRKNSADNSLDSGTRSTGYCLRHVWHSIAQLAMQARPLFPNEFAVLSHFRENGMMDPDDFDTAVEYNQKADIALQLYECGLLISDMEKPYRRNTGLREYRYLQVGVLRPSPTAFRILKFGYPVYVISILSALLLSSGAALMLLKASCSV